MPISDLLAEISGEKTTTSTPSPSIRTSTAIGLKRKADDDGSNTTNIKNPRTQQNGAPPRSSISRRPSPSSSRVPNPSTKSSTSQAGQRSASATPAGSKPYAGTATANRQAGAGPAARRDLTERPKLPSSTVGPSKIAPAKPSPTTSNASEPSKAPKKGSFAEIMARGAKAQQIMPKAGIIQHKALEKPLPKKERETAAKGAKRPGTNGTVTTGSGRGGASQGKNPRTVPKSGAVGDAKAGGKSRPTSSGSDAPEKKKKGPAMIGYSGTARSAPPTKKSASSGKGASSRHPPGGLLAPPKVARRDRYDDEYDEDLDDFVVDDEDDDNPYAGRQYGYASDGSSDMEAGMDDIYDEESRAERMARLEDRREEALNERLKREKEAKKRRSGLL